MTVPCPACQRRNAPRRRYCGGCGVNLDPVCRACGFANDRDDRFCGGCGDALAAGPAAGPAPEAPPAPRRPDAALAAAAPGLELELPDELAGLFAASASTDPALPDGGIAQDDLDRLFGAAG